MRHAFAPLGLGLALFAVAPGASAQAAEGIAETLFNEGRLALEWGELDVACEKLRESDRLDPANGTKFNLADCEEKRGRLASAFELYQKLSVSLPANDERRPYVTQRAAELETRVPRLVIALAPGAPPDTQVKLGSLTLTAASFGSYLPIDPGTVTLVASSPASSRTYKVTLKEGERKTVEVTPLAEPKPAAAKGASAAKPAQAEKKQEQPQGSGGTRTLGFVLGGVGAAGLIFGTVTGIMTISKKNEGDENCNDDLKLCNQRGFDANESARTLGVMSTVGFVVGAAGLGAGAYLLLTSDSDEQVALGTRLNAGSASLVVDGRF
jgi:hypothetical protein